jgi:hypothetical protein
VVAFPFFDTTSSCAVAFDGVASRRAVIPFFVIRGSFHLVGKTPRGNPGGFQPDGDSMQFKPDKPRLLDQLDPRR